METNGAFSMIFIAVAGAQALVYPFLTNDYGLDDLIRFDLRFGEQIEVLFM